MSGQISMIANGLITLQNGQCESTFDEILSIVETVVKDVHGVLSFLCKYKDAIMLGEAVVGLGEAVPIEKEICSINDDYSYAKEIYEQAMFVVKAYEQDEECSELRYGITQYVSQVENS